MEILPSNDTPTLSGFIVTSPKGIMVWVGIPNCTVLICKVTGILLVSLVLKKTSHLVRHIPFLSSTKNVWANGSVYLTVWVVVVCWFVLRSTRSIVSTVAFLIRKLVASIFSNIPFDVKSPTPELSLNPYICEFTGLVVIVKVFVPVSNDGVDGTVGSGINNDPINVPYSSLIILSSDTIATAWLFIPIRRIPFAIHPKNSEIPFVSKLEVSIFNIVVVAE